ncbi:MAG: DNA primase [Alphaproteobacteria bacterium]
MAIPASFIDQIKVRIRVSDVISKRLRVERKGREYISLCPFHNDSKPSLTINDEKGFYHCFACGAHGNAFDFLVNYEGLSFIESVERLADQLGMQVPKASPEEARRAEKRKNLHDIMELVCRYYEQYLWLPNGKAALDELRRRGLSDETIKKFRLGFAPDIQGHFVSALERQSVDSQQLIDTGMLVTPDDTSRKPYPRFRGRIMFPIFDTNGKPIAFGGRIMDGDGPKYLNSPETILFHKGEGLFAYHHASPNARKKEQLIVGEGYMDVIAMHQAGFDTAVAALGTALTESQLALLWRHVNEPILCFDGDAAGQKAAWRALERALPLLKPGIGLRFALIPEGEDPDSIIQKQGIDALAVIFARSISMSEKIWAYLMDEYSLNSAEDAAAIDGKISNICKEIKNETVRTHMYNFLRQRLWKKVGMQPPTESFSSSANRMDKKRGFFQKDSPWQKNNAPISDVEAKKTTINAQKWQEKILLLTLISHPDLFDDIEERLNMVQFKDNALNLMRQEVLKTLSHYPALDFKELTSHLKREGLAETLSRLALEHKNGFGATHAFIHPNAELKEALDGWNDIWRQWWDIPKEQEELKRNDILSNGCSDEELSREFDNIREIKSHRWSQKEK